LNEKYLYIGIFISQGTEFDHRLAREVGNTSTGKDGSFELKDVGEGDYIVVAEKEGYGWRYVFDVAVNSQLVGGGGGGRSVAGDAAWLQDLHNAEMGSKRWMRKSSALYSS